MHRNGGIVWSHFLQGRLGRFLPLCRSNIYTILGVLDIICPTRPILPALPPVFPLSAPLAPLAPLAPISPPARSARRHLCRKSGLKPSRII